MNCVAELRTKHTEPVAYSVTTVTAQAHNGASCNVSFD